MFKIATNSDTPKPYGSIAGPTDGVVDYSKRPTHAERKHRQIIEAIETCETEQEVTEVLRENDEILDNFFLNYPDYAEAIDEAATDHKANLRHGADAGAPAPIPATAHNEEAKENKGNKMFNINTNTGGDSGPFLNYKNRAGQGMGDGTWFLRSKDGDSWHYDDMTERFKQGFVADVFATHDGQLGGTLKLGFIKFQDGVAPERHVWASPLREEQRRSEEKTAQGGYAWQNSVSFRMALGGGEDALFDVNGWSGYKGVMALIDQMNSGFAANIGKCPLVQYTGFRVEGQGQKRLHVPEFKIGSWVDRPDCLKAETPAIATAATPGPAATPAPAPAPEPERTAATAGGF